MSSAELARALLDAAWITARIAAGLAALGAMVAVVLVHGRAGASPVARRRAGVGPRVAAARPRHGSPPSGRRSSPPPRCSPR